jgi:acetyl esterase
MPKRSDADVAVEDRSLPGGPYGLVPVRIVRPLWAALRLPVVIYIQGDGWAFGNTHTHDRLVHDLAVGAGAAVVFPYACFSTRRGFSAAAEEVYSVALWVARQGAQEGFDPGNLAIAGDSIGGNMASAVALLAMERGGPKIVGQLLLYPVRDAAMEACLSEVGKLPPALVITGQTSALRYEGAAYNNKLRESGLGSDAAHLGGLAKDFLILNSLAITSAARGALGPATEWLREGWAAK